MVIVGLGNPGSDYARTRHNVGFMVLDRLAARLAASWKREAGVAWFKHESHYLIKPERYMNASGEAVNTFFRYKNIVFTPAQMLVVHDDLDLPLGTVKPDIDRSSGGHQGVENIIQVFGTQGFQRLRIGIGSNRDRIPQLPAEDFVLQPFAPDERAIIDQALTQATEMIMAKFSG